MNASIRYLRLGFSLATRRGHRVLIDMSVKLLWLAATVAAWTFAAIWLASRMPLTDAAVRSLRSGTPQQAAAAIVGTLLSNATGIGVALLAIALACALSWFILEAFVHAGLLPVSGYGFLEVAATHFTLYLWTGLLRRLVLGLLAGLTAVLALGPLLSAPVGEWGRIWPEIGWAALAGSAMIAVSAFCLMFLETLLRTDAVEAPRPEIALAIGIIVPLAILETGLLLMAAIVALTALLGGASAGLLIVVGVLLTLLVSASHSYLLLVRYSAVGIMLRERSGRQTSGVAAGLKIPAHSRSSISDDALSF